MDNHLSYLSMLDDRGAITTAWESSAAVFTLFLTDTIGPEAKFDAWMITREELAVAASVNTADGIRTNGLDTEWGVADIGAFNKVVTPLADAVADSRCIVKAFEDAGSDRGAVSGNKVFVNKPIGTTHKDRLELAEPLWEEDR